MDILLGCGHSRKRLIFPERKEWVDLFTVDINPEVKPDREWDLNKIPLPFPDNSAEEIHAYNVLEHLGTQGDERFFFSQFEDFWRILKPGGYFCGMVPIDGNVWTWGDPGHRRVINVGTLSFLDQGNYEECETTMRTDYRWIYKGNFQLVLNKVMENDTLYFVLKAVK